MPLFVKIIQKQIYMNSPDYIVILTSMFRGDATRRGMVGNSRSNGTKCFL